MTAQIKGCLAEQLQAALAHRWLIEQDKGSSWVGRRWTLRLPLSACVGQPNPQLAGWPMWPRT
jgi:hypothetical protein